MPQPPLARLPHVGRDAELKQLAAWLSEAGAGRGSVQLVAGQAGIGKTRLVTELAERASRENWTVAVGRVYSVERGVPYAMWSDALTGFLRAMDAGSRSVLTRGGGWLGTICPALSTDAAPALDPEAQRDGKARLLWNFAQFLARAGERQPLLLVLENLHLADAASLELLHFVARQIGGHRVAIAGTYNEAELDRNSALRDMEQSLLALGAAQLVRLDPLAQRDVEQLVASALDGKHEISRQLAGRLYAWTRGNPFFVEEALKALIESGRLHRRDGRWLGWETEVLDLPHSVRSVVLQRLEHLGPDARALAGIASVIGAHLSFGLLQDAAEMPREAALAAIDELVGAGILVEVRDGGAADYDFTHPILQDVIYDALGTARARLLHAGVARAIERRMGGEALAQADALAFHYSRADASTDAGKAALYLAAAGRDALARHADRAAADYLSAALERQPGNADAHTLIDLLAQARQRLGEYDAAMALWQRARADARNAGNVARSARIERRMGLACYWTGRFEQALAHFDEALESAGSARDDAQRAQTLISRGACSQSLGRPADTGRDLDEALTIAQRVGEPALLARAQRALLFLRVFVGPPDAARRHGEEAVRLAETCGDGTVAWSAHYGLATLAGLTGDGRGMLLHVERAERLAEELQSPVMRVHTDELSMQYAFASGDWDAGIALGERAIGMARALNQHSLLPRLLTWITRFFTARGDFTTARRYLDEAWELGVAGAERGKPAEVHTQIAVHAGMASYHLIAGDHGRAVATCEKGLELADRAGYAVWAVYPLLPVVAEACFYMRDVERGRRHVQRMEAESQRMGHRLGLVWVLAAQGIIARFEDEHSRSAELMRQAIASLEGIPWVYDAARLRRWLADVLIRMGRQEEGVALLKQSYDVCSQLGARVELERAREMMKQVGVRPPVGAARSRVRGVAGLTARERDIARLVAARKANKEIAAELKLSVRTVTTHVANIFAKLKVRSRGELADRVREGDT